MYLSSLYKLDDSKFPGFLEAIVEFRHLLLSLKNC